MKAYVILANDSVEHVVLGGKEQAEEIKKRLQQEFEDKYSSYPLQNIYWHINETSYTFPDWWEELDQDKEYQQRNGENE